MIAATIFLGCCLFQASAVLCAPWPVEVVLHQAVLPSMFRMENRGAMVAVSLQHVMLSEGRALKMRARHL